MQNRRAFLKFLAASPLLSELAPLDWARADDALIASAADALDVFDFEAVARKVLPPAHWGYMASGVDGEETLRANREGFKRYALRSRRFVDVSRMDLTTEVLGMKLTSPVVLNRLSRKSFFPKATFSGVTGLSAGMGSGGSPNGAPKATDVMSIAATATARSTCLDILAVLSMSCPSLLLLSQREFGSPTDSSETAPAHWSSPVQVLRKRGRQRSKT